MPLVTRNTLLERMTAPPAELLGLIAGTDEVTERILAAAFEQMAAVGWRRSTIEDVARRARVGRATVYRKFPSKADLTDAVMHSELRKYLTGSTAACQPQATVIERMAQSAAFTVEFLHGHPLLKRLIETEPETILPALTVDAGPLIEKFRELCATQWQHEFYGDAHVSDDEVQHLRTVAELHIRIALSLILTQPSAIPLESPDDASEFTRRYLAPMLDAH